MPRVLVPRPDRDFDVTEVAVPWRVLTDSGVDVVFATERGANTPAADPRLLDGVLCGQLGAYPEPKQFYRELLGDEAFQAPGMRQYLASQTLREVVFAFWATGRRTTCLPKFMERGAYYLVRWPGDAYLFATRFRALLA